MAPSAIYAIGYFCSLLVFALGVGCAWPEYIERRKASEVRSALYVALAIASSGELCIWWVGAVRPWVLFLAMFCTWWGAFDAFLRYPTVHEIYSPFAFKQTILLATKLAGYIMGFRTAQRSMTMLVVVMVGCLFTPLILWLLALPIGEVVSSQPTHDVVDVDILVQVWRVLVNPTDRATFRLLWRARVRRLVLQAAQAVPSLHNPLLRLDPSLERALKGAREL
mmetsp:Transcript_153731/g.492893  ORF Transcript_153731/g.492893 Transcript_153731/m.492893 type:complete len:223 (-) Transcript_153731:121-789(-)|eukprot:CAMPEP_0203868498 /NCGR_PEP_ID=MMETSP0359-20131031/17140_1 /ASSEMBLY_ACC=CAM_ASM_000338 /TAXON_ID=268821 /ORGANISM="Scrippsiella Hangoei, Strain SHTV-5" /LENGTH=222 /DNA_ID=CAMNT_0050786917 /DNA_START=111 /DNA_END=779 /DNA_ORIENTATION=+